MMETAFQNRNTEAIITTNMQDINNLAIFIILISLPILAQPTKWTNGNSRKGRAINTPGIPPIIKATTTCEIRD